MCCLIKMHCLKRDRILYLFLPWQWNASRYWCCEVLFIHCSLQSVCNRPFTQQAISLIIAGKAQEQLITIMMVVLCVGALESHVSKTAHTQQAFNTVHILSCRSQKSSGVTNNKCLCSGHVSQETMTVWQWATMNNTTTMKLMQLNGIKPSLILLLTPVQDLLPTTGPGTPKFNVRITSDNYTCAWQV